uniref:Uncharacterized protein n=1 Tax=Parascaris equorum TaxID=6256 RepID=A0A914R070_PAREQ
MATMRHPSWPRSRERSPNLRITTLSYSTSKNSGMSCSMKSNAMSRKPQGIMARRNYHHIDLRGYEEAAWEIWVLCTLLKAQS